MIAYTDGAATMIKLNGEYLKGNGGHAFVLLDKEEIVIKGSGGSVCTTNNEQELLGIYEAILAYRKLNTFEDLIIYSDSAYCVNTFNSWAKRWESNGWTKKGGEIKNLKLIQSIWNELKQGNITLKKVKGHNGVKWNEIVDKMAVMEKKKCEKSKGEQYSE